MAKKQAIKKALVPELRFPEFRGDGEWTEIPLAKLSSRLRRKVGSKKLTPVSITAGQGFVDQTAKFGRRIAGDQYKNYIHIQRGDFVYNKGNSKTFAQGCIYQLKEFEEAAASTAFICFKLHEEGVDHYFQSLFEYNAHGRKLRKFITSGARSDGLLNINPTDFFSIELPVPPRKAEQQKIAECLGSLDDLIAAHSAKLDALQANRDGFLQQLFPADGGTVPVIRFPGFEEDWETFEVDEILKSVSTRGHQIPNSAINKEGKHPVVDQAKEPVAGYSDQSSRLFKKTPIIVFGDHTTVIKFVDFDFVVGADGTKLLQKKRKPDCLRFLSYALERYKMAQDGYKRHFSILRKVRMGVPTPEEQERIAGYLATLDAIIASQTDQIDALIEHKSGLMQKLFPNPDLSKA